MIERKLPVRNVMVIQGRECAFGDITTYKETADCFNMNIKMTKGTLRVGQCNNSHILVEFDVLRDGFGASSS